MTLAADHRFRQSGFTLVELVMTIVIVGILAVVAIPRFFDSDVFQSHGAAEQLRSALRYGQKVAIAQHRHVSVQVSAGATPDCGAALAAGNVSCVISNKVGVTPALPMTVTFDALGRPAAAASATVGATVVTVEAETGYVH